MQRGRWCCCLSAGKHAMADCRGRLYRCGDIFDHRATDSLFLGAVRENVRFHQKYNPVYRRMLKAEGFSANSMERIEDLHRIPPIPTAFFKRHTLWTMDPGCLAVRATSSGTGGLVSRIGLEWAALARGAAMAARLGKVRGLFSPVPVNYIVLGYEPHRENQTAISKTQRASLLYAPPLQVKYALKRGAGGYRPDFPGVKRALERYAGQKVPVRLVGFPAYLYFLLLELKREGLRFRFPAGSMVLLGGGWKQFYREQPEKEAVYRLLEEVLGIGEESCREFYGAVEHPSMYCDCGRHHFHVPVYSRVIIRDVDTLRPLGFGQPGLVNLIPPIADSMPLVSVMTDDLGILYPGESCGCGNQAPYFEILGRVGLSEIRTCAAGAAQILEGG